MAKVNKVSVFANFVLTGLITASCVAPAVAPSVSPVPAISSVAGTNKTVSTGVAKDADSIDQHVTNAESKTPASAKTVLQPEFTGIRNDTADLRQLKGQLDTTIGALDVAQQQAKTQQDTIGTLQKQNSDLQAKNNTLFKTAFVILIVLAVVGIGASAALIYIGNSLGIALGIGSAVTLVVAIFVNTYAVILAIAGGVLVLGGIGYFVYTLYQKNKTITTTKAVATKLTATANELVQTVEATKMAMRPEARYYMFGNGPIGGHVDMIQSSDTKQFVRSARKDTSIKLAPSLVPISLGTGEEPSVSPKLVDAV